MNIRAGHAINRRRRGERADHWRAHQRAYLHNRREKLKQIYSEELQAEHDALRQDWVTRHGVPRPTIPNPYNGAPLFFSPKMDGSSGYILEDISKFVSGLLTKDEFEHIEKICREDDGMGVMKGWGNVRTVVYLRDSTNEDDRICQFKAQNMAYGFWLKLHMNVGPLRLTLTLIQSH